MTKKAKKKTPPSKESLLAAKLIEGFADLATSQMRVRTLAMELFRAVDVALQRLDKLAHQMEDL